ncbi:Proteasome subunit alpha type-2, partial [Cladochytrium tenue]
MGPRRPAQQHSSTACISTDTSSGGIDSNGDNDRSSSNNTSTMGDRYSFSLTTFSPSGKLVQIEYALNAVGHGDTSIGIK